MITGILLTLLSLVSIGVFIYRAGIKRERLSQVKEDLKDVEDAKKISDDVAALTDYDVVDKLRNKWTK